jgi:hypothetical protein
MDIQRDAKRRNDAGNEAGRIESDKDSIKNALHSAIGNALDDETLQEIQDMIENMIAERQNAIEWIDKARRSLLKKILDEHKKTIQVQTIGTIREEVIKPKNTKETVERVPAIEKTAINEGNTNQAITTNNQNKADDAEMTLEILPPRDQNAITIINNYLNNMPEVLKVELHTLADKTVFKLILSEPVNLIEKLHSLPQVLDTEEVFEFGQKKIKISLTSVFI